MTCPRSPFSKEYVKIMQTIKEILKPYVFLPYHWNTKPYKLCTFPHVPFSTFMETSQVCTLILILKSGPSLK